MCKAFSHLLLTPYLPSVVSAVAAHALLYTPVCSYNSLGHVGLFSFHYRNYNAVFMKPEEKKQE